MVTRGISDECCKAYLRFLVLRSWKSVFERYRGDVRSVGATEKMEDRVRPGGLRWMFLMGQGNVREEGDRICCVPAR